MGQGYIGGGDGFISSDSADGGGSALSLKYENIITGSQVVTATVNENQFVLNFVHLQYPSPQMVLPDTTDRIPPANGQTYTITMCNYVLGQAVNVKTTNNTDIYTMTSNIPPLKTSITAKWSADAGVYIVTMISAV